MRTTDRLFEKYNTYTRRPAVLDKRRVIFRSLERVLGSSLPGDRSARILDVACGEGALLSFLLERGYKNLAGFDLSPENVSLSRQLGLGFVEQHDALRIGEFHPNEIYDTIFCLDILEHIPKEDAAGFLEAARLRLKPSGRLIVQTPNMGCVFGQYHRFNDLSHEYALTEKTAVDLFMLAGFSPERIEVLPAWNATTLLGHAREIYLRALHRAVFLAEDASRPRIPTKNLLIRATRL